MTVALGVVAAVLFAVYVVGRLVRRFIGRRWRRKALEAARERLDGTREIPRWSDFADLVLHSRPGHKIAYTALLEAEGEKRAYFADAGVYFHTDSGWVFWPAGQHHAETA